MVIEIPCVIKNRKVVPLDPDKVEKWKNTHAEGEVFDMLLSDQSSSAQTPMAKKFFALRDEYASINGYTNEHAKVELKYLHGVTAAPDAIPIGRDGQIIEYHGQLIWFQSIRSYDSEQLRRLVSGSDLAVQEASI